MGPRGETVQAYKAKGVGYGYKWGQFWIQKGLSIKSRGSVSRMQGDGSITEPCEIMDVAMLGFDLAWVQYTTIMLG
jgi:hypothetical protein